MKLGVGASLALTGIGGNVLARKSPVGTFLTGTPTNPITEGKIKDHRKQFLSKHGFDLVALSGDPVSKGEEVYGYALRIKEHGGNRYPYEYIESVPTGFGLHQRQRFAKAIHKRAKTVATATYLPDDPYRSTRGASAAGFGSAPILAISDGSHTSYDDTTWEIEGEVHKARYNEYNYWDCWGEHTDTVGRMDLDLPIYRNKSEDETDKEEWACTVELEQWPGVYLEQYDDAVGDNSNGWYNNEARTEQHWTSGDMAPYELHDTSPIGEDTGTFDGSISFGVSAEKIAYAEVTITPDSDEIHYQEQSDPGDSVETWWEFLNASEDDHVVLGNAGAAWTDDVEWDEDDLLEAKVWSEYWGAVPAASNWGCGNRDYHYPDFSISVRVDISYDL